MSVQPTSIAAYNQADLIGTKSDVFKTIRSIDDVVVSLTTLSTGDAT